MRLPLVSCLLVGLALSPAISRAASEDYTLEITHPSGNMYVLTRWAKTGFARNTDKLERQALADAEAFCEKQNRVLKVLDVAKHRPFIPATGFPYARVTFLALEANDPLLHPAPAAPAPVAMETSAAAPPKSSTELLYSDLMKLEDLRQRGILTDKEFQKLKTRLIDKDR